MVYDAIILSDIHLGTSNCQAKNLVRFLEKVAEGNIATSRLVLNGDVFDSIDFRRLNKNHWKVLSLIRKLSDRIDIIWISGNHDGSADLISHLLGVTVKNETVLTSGSREILFLHGHIFDDFIESHPILTWIGDCIYLLLQWIDKTHSFAKLAKKGSKTFLRCARKIEEGAIERARKMGCTAVCCGHTHHAVAKDDLPLAYYNSGCWTELPCTYLTVLDGGVELHIFGASPIEEPVTEPVLALPKE
ncbi:MAG TPA: UDP-2,3-diacylglucosamine diphosphatase [Gemmataceae bacterium]|jgi:UDP-2,3-diacylglucosamine pyrophosphatase LpxH